MASTPLLSAKLQVPPLPTGVVRRSRLVTRLRAAFAHRLALVSAPPGYGKTTLLSAFAAEVDVPLVWYTLDERDNDPAVFFDYLITGIEGQWPGLTDSARELLDSTEGGIDVEWIATLLLNALGEAGASAAGDAHTPWLIICDDYHCIRDEAINDVLALFLRHLPPQLHLIIGTREDPPLPLATLRAQGHLLELRAEDLRFTVAEIDRMLRKGLARGRQGAESLSGSDVEALGMRTEGWAAAVQMALASMRDHDPGERSAVIHQFDGTLHAIFNYLAQEVYASQPEQLRTFLARTAILDDVSPALCDHVLGWERSDELLSSLARRNLFLFPRDAAHASFRYHDLFRGFLLRRLRQTEGSEGMARLHRRAAVWYLERENDERAVEHLLDAEDFAAAADLIRALWEALLSKGRVHLLERWLSRFPPDVAEGHAWLLLTRARLVQLRGDQAEAAKLCHQAEPLLRRQEDCLGLYTVYHDLGQIARRSGDFPGAERYYRQALDYAVGDTDRALALGLVARCLYMGSGDVETALETLKEALALAARGGQPLGRAELLILQGKMLSSLGDFLGALDAWHTALDLLDALGNRHQQLDLLSNAAYLHHLLGQSQQGEELVQRALTLAQVFERPAQYAYALNIQGVLHRARRAWQAAGRCHEEALAIQRRINDRYEVPTTLNWLAVLRRREGRTREALHLAQEGLALREGLNSDYEIGLSLIDLGAIHLALAETEPRSEPHLHDAEVAWRRAREIFARHEARYEQAKIDLYLAVLAHRRGGEAALEEHLGRAMAVARTYEHGDPSRCLHVFEAEAPWVAPLLAHALCRDLVPQCVDCLLPRLGKPAFRALLPLLDHQSPDTRARAARLLGQLGDVLALQPLYDHRQDADRRVRGAIDRAQQRLLTTPPEPLRVETLGRFRLWRGDREIADWPRSSARHVFLLLLMEQPHPVAAERLSEALWPAAPPDSASRSLRRAVSDLRRTLEPELPPRLPSRYLIVRRGTYALSLPPASFVADIAFEEALSRALRIPARASGTQETSSGGRPEGDREMQSRDLAIEALESAIEQYHGDYLADVPFETWALARREHLRHHMMVGLHRLAALYMEGERYQEALSTAHVALGHERWDEEAVLILMRAYAARRNVPAALRVYESLRDRLRADLDLPPRDDLTALYHRLRERPSYVP